MSGYAEKTTVPAAQSRAEIERTLERFGASSFAYASEARQAMVAFDVKGLRVVFRLPLPDRNDRRFTVTQQLRARSATAAGDLYDQAVRQRWRALALAIKSKLAAVEAGITTIEDEFLAHIQLPDGSTIGEHARPAIKAAYETGSLPALLPGGPN